MRHLKKPIKTRSTKLYCTIAVGLASVCMLGGCQVGQNGQSNIESRRIAESFIAKAQQKRDDGDKNSNEDSPSVEAQSGDNRQGKTIQQVSFVQTGDGVSQPQSDSSTETVETNRYPVDLATVLQLAGADNWNIRIARERIREAAANLDAARAAILPSINFGIVYNVHDGEIQATNGDVITASRNSLFIGGGAVVDRAPLTGGAGGPPRLFIDYSLADAMFKPLAARQRVSAARLDRCRVLNDTLLEATLAYYELVRAQSLLAVTLKNHEEAQRVARLTVDFVEGGKGSEADVDRINVIVNSRKQQVIRAKVAIEVASARLAEVLQLDPCEVDPEVGLLAVEYHPVPIEIIDWNLQLNQHIDAAQESRCEISQAIASAEALNADYEAEFWRSVLPNLYLGYSGGLFGGGTGSSLTGLDFRHDFDVGVTWQIKNLGVGNAASQQAACSRYRRQSFATRQVRDKISQQVTSTYHTTMQYQKEIGLMSANVKQSEQALNKNIDAIRGLEGLPLESIQSLDALAKSRLDYLDSVISYNQWQLRLLRATGQPFADGGCCGANCTCCNCNAKCTSLPCRKRCDCESGTTDCRYPIK